MMRRHHSITTRLLLGATLVLFGCADQPAESPTAPTDLLQLGRVTAPPPTCTATSSATELIDCLFQAPGNANAVHMRFRNVVRQFERGEVETATEMMLDLVDYTLLKKEEGKLLDPQPLGQDAVLSLFLDVLFEAVGLDAPEIPEGALGDDGAVAVVSSLGGVVATATESFGADFAVEALESDALVTIERLPDDAAPLPVLGNQYPPYYRLTINPAPDWVKGLEMGLCFFDSGPLAPPDDPLVRNRLRIARTVPTDDGAVKVLDDGAAPSFIDCSDVTQFASVQRREARMFAFLGERVSDFVEWAITPTELAAGPIGGGTDTILVRGGPGGGTKFLMSASYASYDEASEPGPLPDLIVESVTVLTPSPTDAVELEIEVVVKNIGAADAPPSGLRLELQGGLPNYISATASYPDIPVGGSEARIIRGPVGTIDADTYSATATADAFDLVAESDEFNNVHSSTTFTVAAAPRNSAIVGTITLDGDPMAGATLYTTGPATTLNTVTDASGQYYISGLLAGTYTVGVVTGSLPGGIVFSTPSKTVTLAESQADTVDLSGASLHTSPVGTGTADTWTVVEPTSAQTLCNGLGSDSCSGATVSVSAVASGPTGMFVSEWLSGTIYFYYRDDVTGLHTYLGQVSGGNVLIYDDAMTTRTYTWTITLDAAGIPAGPLELIAVGVTSSRVATATPANTNVAIANGTP